MHSGRDNLGTYRVATRHNLKRENSSTAELHQVLKGTLHGHRSAVEEATLA